MATLTDDEKAKKMIEEVESESSDDTSTQTNDQPETEESQEAASETEQEKPEATAEEQPGETDSSESDFTKQFQNLKGDSWDTYGPELEKAYVNSTTEALKIRQDLKDAQAKIAELSQQAPAQPSAQTPVANPDIDWLKSERQKSMLDAFGQFSQRYPDATEVVSSDEAFAKFEQVANNAENSFLAIHGRRPTYPELFEQTAQLYGWQPADKKAQKEAAIKDTLAQGAISSLAQPAPKRSSISEAQLEMARKMFPGKKDADLVKELAPYAT